MQYAEKSFQKLVLVCTNVRDDGTQACGPSGGAELHPAIKQALREVAPHVRVSKTGCLGTCLSGCTVVIMPDNIWLGGVTMEDIPKIVAHVLGTYDIRSDLT